MKGFRLANPDGLDSALWNFPKCIINTQHNKYFDIEKYTMINHSVMIHRRTFEKEEDGKMVFDIEGNAQLVQMGC